MKKGLLKIFICSVLLLGLIGCESKNQKEDINLESLVNEDGLIFTISANINCVPLELSIYSNGKYELRDAYKVPKDAENVNSILIYSEPSITGTYDYDILKIIENSIFEPREQSMYEIYTGKGEVYTTDSDNGYLMEFLESIDIDLDVCAKKDYN